MIKYFKSKDAAKKLISKLSVENEITLYADVTKQEDVERKLQSATAHYGQMDVVFNNALVGFKFDSIAQNRLSICNGKITRMNCMEQ